MKKIVFCFSLFLPILVTAQAEMEMLGGSVDYGGGKLGPWIIFGWLMLLCVLVWTMVGILASIWLYKSINK